MEVLSQGQLISAAPSIGIEGQSPLRAGFWTDAPSFLEPIYRTAVFIFLINTAFDSGSTITKTFLGLSPTMIAMMLLMGVGLLFWTAPRDKVVIGCSILIGIWALSQVFMGHSLRWSFFVVSLLGFSLVIAGARTNHSLLWF